MLNDFSANSLLGQTFVYGVGTDRNVALWYRMANLGVTTKNYAP
jgi:hypothetical protein